MERLNAFYFRIFCAITFLVLGLSAPRFAQAQSVVEFQHNLRDRTVLLERGETATKSVTDDSVDLAHGDLAMTFLDQSAISQWSGEDRRYMLPLDMVGVAETGEVLKMRLVVVVAGGGLRMNSPEGEFTGTLHIGLEDIEAPTTSHGIGREVGMLVTANADVVNPTYVPMTHTNTYSDVQLTARAPSDSVRVQVRPQFDANTTELFVPVVRPSLTLNISPRRIQGFGLEAATITVGIEGAPSQNSRHVSLSSQMSRTQPSSILLGNSEIGEATIRSSGLGVDLVRVSSPSLLAAELPVEFAFPWAFVLAALLGGLVGGAIRVLNRGGRPSAILPALIVSVLSAIVITVAYAVGINILRVQPSAVVGEALVFAISALGAVAGASLLTKQVTAPA